MSEEVEPGAKGGYRSGPDHQATNSAGDCPAHDFLREGFRDLRIGKIEGADEKNPESLDLEVFGGLVVCAKRTTMGGSRSAGYLRGSGRQQV